MKQFKTKILENKQVAQGFYRMRIESPYLANNSKPGQFVEVKCSDENEPLLRRPLGVHRIFKSGIEMLYEIVGKGTKLLSGKKSGEYIDIIGPLGNGFNVEKNLKSAILIAGGIGVAPIMSLAEQLVRGKKIHLHVLIGACKKSHVLCKNDFKKIGADVFIATEDGSMGKKGLVTDLFKDLLYAKRYPLNATLYACGPTGMLKAVAKIAHDKKMPCQVSLEERMACGVGVCLGCPVKIKGNGYKMVCKDGPVFNAEEILW